MSIESTVASGSVRRTRILAVPVLFACLAGAFAQTTPPPLVTDIPADALIKRVEPIYPPIAQAAHITGMVNLEFTISTKGDVTDVKVLGGHPMLQQAAIDAVKQWKYRPILLNEKPFAVRNRAVFNFGFDPSSADDRKEQEVNARVSPLMIQCTNLLNTNNPGSVDACKKEVELEEQYPPGRRKMDRLSAHDEYGLALLGFAHKPKEALEQFEMEIGLIPGVLSEKNAEYAWAYWHRGVARMRLGDLARSEQDFTIAEASAFLAEKNLPDMAERYERTRQKIISMHVRLLENEGRTDDALKLRQATEK